MMKDSVKSSKGILKEKDAASVVSCVACGKAIVGKDARKIEKNGLAYHLECYR